MSDSYFIGIVGGSGSGKTTLLKRLKADFGHESVCFISLDDYYLPRENQHLDDKGFRNFDLPESIDSDSLYRDIIKLKNDEAIERTEYTFNNAEATSRTLVFKPSKVYIIEGLFIYHYEKIRSLFDLKLFVEAKENIKVIRRIKRDRVERNYELEDVLYRYEHHVLPSYEKYIQPYLSFADLIINNNDSFDEAYNVIRIYIQTKLV